MFQRLFARWFPFRRCTDGWSRKPDSNKSKCKLETAQNKISHNHKPELVLESGLDPAAAWSSALESPTTISSQGNSKYRRTQNNDTSKYIDVWRTDTFPPSPEFRLLPCEPWCMCAFITSRMWLVSSFMSVSGSTSKPTSDFWFWKNRMCPWTLTYVFSLCTIVLRSSGVFS